MHANRTAPRLSNFDNKPRPDGSSRAASLQYSPSSYLDEKRNFTTSPRPVNARTLGETPATRLLSLQMKVIPLGFLKNEPSTLLSLKHSSASAPSSARIRPRSTSYCVPQRNAMPAARVKRWAGPTRTVSDWDGLRKVRAHLESLETSY